VAAEAKIAVRGPLGVTLLEVLGSLMPPERAELMALRALGRAGWSAIPEDPGAIAQLIEGPLSAILAEEVGLEATAFVLEDLVPILDLAASGVRRTRPNIEGRSLPTTQPAPPRMKEGLRIAVLTLGSLEQLRRQIGPFAEVTRVRDAFELFTLIDTRDVRLLVVIDGHRPAADLSTLVTLMPRIPDGCRVILWGFDPSESAPLAALDRWTVSDAGPDWADLAGALRDVGD